MNNIDKIQYSKEDIAILGRLVSVANDGVVASAWQIWDDLLKEWLGELNKRFNSSIQHLDINTSTLGVELQALKDEVAQIKIGGIVDIIVNGEHMRDGSDLVVDLGTVIREHQSLDNYYTKDQLYTKADLYTKDRLYTKDDLYTKEEVDYFIQVIPKLDKIVLDHLPSDWSEYADNLVLVPAETTGDNDYYDEYIVIVTEVEMPDGFKRLNYTPEKIGTTRVDLSRYATKEDLLSSESQLRDEMQEIYVDTQNTWNAWQLVKNRPGGWAGLDTSGKIPSSIIPMTDIFDPSNYYTKQQTDGLLSGKQDTVQDLAEIRAGAAAGATAVQPAVLEPYATQAWVGEQGFLTLHLDISGKEDKVNVVNIVSGTASVNAQVGKHYIFDKDGGRPLNTFTLYLPVITSTDIVQNILFSFWTSSAPSLTITPPDGVDVVYMKGYSIQPNENYELNIMWNGLKWIVAYGFID